MDAKDIKIAELGDRWVGYICLVALGFLIGMTAFGG